MANPTGLQFTLAPANGSDADLAVIDFDCTETLSTPFELCVVFASRRPDLAPADWLDREVSLTVWQDGVALRRFHGIVSEFAQGDRGHRRSHYSIVVRPALWRLSLRHNSRIFQRVSSQPIITTLLAERGISDVAFSVTREPVEREYCVQYRETDLAFIARLAAEEGWCYFHAFAEDGAGGHRLVFADAPQTLPRLGARPYHHRAGGRAPLRHIRRLRQTARVRPTSVALKDYSFKQPAYAQLHERQADGLEAHAQPPGSPRHYEHYDYPGRYKADASGQAFTQVRLEHLRADALSVAAESDLPELLPGAVFTLTGHDDPTLNRDWQVVGVVHEGSQPQALEEEATGSDAMTRYGNKLTLVPADRAWRPTPNPQPRVDGPQVAVVVGPEGEEIHCDEHGRVKVRFPWDRYAKRDDTAGAGGDAAKGDSSAWLRVSQGWAGGGYGAMAIPRIGHEVIVSFLEGDPDQPLITGRTYHAVNTPPYALPEHKTRTVIRTQTHQGEGFNELRFEDERDREQIWLHAQKDLELITGNDRTEAIRRDSHLAVKRDRLTEIVRDTHLSVHGERREQIDGDDSLIVGRTRHEKIGRAQLVEAGREIHYRAGQHVVLDAGAEITLQAGGSFLKLDPSGVTLAGPSVKVNAGGSPGLGSGQDARTPLLPGHVQAEVHEAIASVPHQQSLNAGNGAEMPVDDATKVLVILEHKDTLGRPLPEGIRVEVRDSRLKSYVSVTDTEGVSQHSGVIAGPFSWQLLEAPGRHLVAIDDQPVHPIAAGLGAPEANAVMHETTVTATYLPPPLLIDLHTPPSSGADRLSDDQLEQLRLAGQSATLFVHGYNVARGEWGRFSIEAEAADAGGPFLFGAPLLRPSGAAMVSTLCQSQASDADSRGLNGSGACSWLASMELQLNRAAGLSDDDWRPYSRVVGIAWPGDTGSTDFVEAEFNAMQSGRRLVTVLGQLIDAKLSINIVSHSLGARVVLSALNILGDRITGSCIDNLFLWEPAVADNALSPDSPFTPAALKGGYDETFGQGSPGRETHPLGMGTFPMAHRSAKNIVVLHSREDGILGSSDEPDTSAWYDPRDWLDDVAAFAGDSQDDRLGTLGGAYPKKWWTFPPLLAGGLGYFREYYFERARALGGGWEAAMLVHLQQRARDEPHIQYRIERAWDALTQAILDEAHRVAAAIPTGPLDPDIPLPAYDLLKPLSHHYKIDELMAARFAERLRQLGQRDNWQPRDRRVRPALGLVGFKKVEKVEFFTRKLTKDTFDFVDQSTWLFAHSAMKYPTEEIFIKSYQDGIMKEIQRNSNFGRY